jgi:hypothetical protein
LIAYWKHLIPSKTQTDGQHCTIPHLSSSHSSEQNQTKHQNKPAKRKQKANTNKYFTNLAAEE